MAERHQLKIADRHDIAEDDPFAELTRIMGFDPREPVKSQEPTPETAQHDDFAIDLEKELLGEFAEYNTPASASPPASDAAEASDPHATDMRQPARHPGEEHAPAEAYASPDVEALDFEADLSAGFDNAFADLNDADTLYSEEPAPDSLAFEPEVRPEPPVSSLPPEDFTETAPSARHPWFGPTQAGDEYATEGELGSTAGGISHGPEYEFDTAVAADLEDGFSTPEEAAGIPAQGVDNAPGDHYAARDDLSSAETAWQSTEAGWEPVQQQSLHPIEDVHDFDAYFDDAMAAIDMDFTSSEQAEPVFDEAGGEETAIAAEYTPVAEHEAHADSADAIDSAFHDAFSDIGITEPAPVMETTFGPGEAPQGEEAWADGQERSQAEAGAAAPDTLEDELNSLLAKMTARPAVAAASAWPLATPVARKESGPAERSPEPSIARDVNEDELKAALLADLHSMELGEADEKLAEVDDSHATLAEATWTEAESAPSAHAGGKAQEEVPEIETVEVPERVVALADDLDIPDVPFDESGSEERLHGDLEDEFAELLDQMNASPAQVHASHNDDAAVAGYRVGAGAAQTGPTPVEQAPDPDFDPSASGLYIDNLANGTLQSGADPFAVEELEYDPEESPALAAGEAETTREPRRGLLIAGIIGAVAIAGGLGALAMSFGGGGADEVPALVKADDTPIKVKPENPGGIVIPNQDNKVYEAVAKGTQPTVAPKQQELVTSDEEPVDVTAMAPRAVGDGPADPVNQAGEAVEGQRAEGESRVAKSEDRIEPTVQDDSVASQGPLVTPRKVRTMVVKPDGTLVPREEAAPQVAAAEPVDPAPQQVMATDQTGAVSQPETSSAPAETVGAEPQTIATPNTAPIAPQRPSDQPVDVVGEVKPDQVAALDTNSAAAAGAWSMQIASQPTEESARATYQDLARRYAGVLEGRSVNIVKAEIAGKGTFYRVRIPAQSRNEAVRLCETYKAAGGNCFVSK